MIGRLLCKLLGHKRGRRVNSSAEVGDTSRTTLLYCHRCGYRWTRKAKAKK